MTRDLFEDDELPDCSEERLAPGTVLLRGFARDSAPELIAAVEAVIRAAPFRHMSVPGGLRMSVAMSNCGALGWTSDEQGYRYRTEDPLSGLPWPLMPALLSELATHAAERAGFPGFLPDACLINRYAPGARMGLHQDRDERDFGAPIVSVSLGLPATFLFGGSARRERQQRIPLRHGDAIVWGGPDRLRYHGVAPLKDGAHPLLGAQRLNLTFRKAG